MNKTFGILAAASLALGMSTSLALAQATISVGSAGPMTGALANFGTQLRKGAEMAVADINAAGGVMGKKLVLEIGDDQCDPKQAVAVANQLASKKVAVVFGHFCSGSSIPANDVYNDAKILQITPASTNPKLTEQGRTMVFRACGRDDIQGAFAGKYINQTYKGKNIAIIHDKSAYGKGVADETRKALKGGPTKEVMYDSLTAGEKDFSALVSKMKAAKTDVIVFGGYHPEGGILIKQAREQGLNAQMIGFDALVDKEFGQIAGKASDGVLMTDAPDYRLFPSAAAVVAKFKAASYDPEGYTLRSYASVQVWAEAVKKAGSTDSAKVAAALRAGKYKTVIGELGYDKKGDIVNPEYAFYVWKDGNYAQRK